MLTGANGANGPVKTLLFPPAASGVALSPLVDDAGHDKQTDVVSSGSPPHDEWKPCVCASRAQPAGERRTWPEPERRVRAFPTKTDAVRSVRTAAKAKATASRQEVSRISRTMSAQCSAALLVAIKKKDTFLISGRHAFLEPAV